MLLTPALSYSSQCLQIYDRKMKPEKSKRKGKTRT